VEEALILVVEDDDDLRAVMRDVFSAAGARALEAAGGIEAWSLLETHAVDVVVSDMRMAHGNGEDLLRRIKASDSLKALPVIIVTGYSDVNKKEMLRLGAAAVLAKPFEVSQLVKTVSSCLKQG